MEDVEEKTVDIILASAKRPSILEHLISLLIKMKHKLKKKKARHNRWDIRRRHRVTSFLDYFEDKTKKIILKRPDLETKCV